MRVSSQWISSLFFLGLLSTFALGQRTSFCFGDVSGTPCACGNRGFPGNSCANSVDSSGGNLIAFGSASIWGDTFVLEAGGMPNGSALDFQGTTELNGGLGSVFGDGLRCVGGSLVRLGTKTNVAGASRYRVAGDPKISVRYLMTSPSTRTYQAPYRSSAAFGNVQTFNLEPDRSLRRLSQKS